MVRLSDDDDLSTGVGSEKFGRNASWSVRYFQKPERESRGPRGGVEMEAKPRAKPHAKKLEHVSRCGHVVGYCRCCITLGETSVSAHARGVPWLSLRTRASNKFCNNRIFTSKTLERGENRGHMSS